MADITLSSRTVVRPYRERAGSPLVLTFDASTCASTATIRYGQVVQFDIVSETASHRLVRTSTAAGEPNLSTNIAGIAARSDTSDGSTLSANGARPIQIYAASPTAEFLFPSKIAGVASTLIGTNLALGFDSTLGIHYLNANSTAGDRRVVITDVPNPGDTNGYLAGRFLSTAVSPTVWPR